MVCERCQDSNKTEVTDYIITKGEAKRRTVLCDACAEITRTVHKLSGGKAPEAEKPSAPEAAADVTEPTEESVVNDKPASSSGRRGYGSTR